MADVYADPFGDYAQRTVIQQQDYNLMEADRINRQDYRMDKNVQRQDYR